VTSSAVASSTAAPTIAVSRYISLSENTVHYLEAGKGPTLLLLHGTALDSAAMTYGAMIPKLAEHFHVYALDWLGYGESDKPMMDYTSPNYSSLLAEFIETLGLETFSIVAFSMGGAMALGYALEHQERLHKLVLIDSYGLGRIVHIPTVPYLLLHLPGVTELIWKLLTVPKILELCLKYIIFGSAKRVTPEILADVRRQLELRDLQHASTSWLRSEIGLWRLTTQHKHLGALNVPTLLMHGSKDIVIPAWRSRRAARAIPKAQLQMLRGYGHWTPREASKEVLEYVLHFLTT
jgi:pimeloyl-ACP methyl ester carboxylesterase